MDDRIGMIAWFERWMERLRTRPRLKIDVAGARPLSSTLTIYVIDVDGRRTVLAAATHALCVLSSYPTPPSVVPEGPQTASV
jgi:flagellar biogenesis protein FliO